MYGQDDDLENNEFIREIMEFELEVFKKDPKQEMLLAATLIVANKIIDKKTFDQLWKDIKMVAVLEYAREKGYDEGKKDGALSNAKQMLEEIIEETIGVVPGYIQEKIQQISNQTTLKGLLRQAIRCNDINEFNQKLTLAVG